MIKPSLFVGVRRSIYETAGSICASDIGEKVMNEKSGKEKFRQQIQRGRVQAGLQAGVYVLVQPHRQAKKACAPSEQLQMVKSALAQFEKKSVLFEEKLICVF